MSENRGNPHNQNLPELHKTSSGVSPGIERVFCLFLVAVSLFLIYHYLIVLPYNTEGVDYRKHHIAARCILEGKNPYLGEHNENYLSFNYPVFTGVLYVWLAAFEYEPSEIVWGIWGTLLILLSAVAVWRLYRPFSPAAGEIRPENVGDEFRRLLQRQWWAVGPFLVLFYTPAIIRTYDGNIEPTMLILMVLFGGMLLGKRETAAGIFLALASLVKVLPVFLIVVFIIGRRWRVVMGCFAVWIVYLFVLTISGWWRWEWFFLTDVLVNAPFKWKGVSESLASIVAELCYHTALTDPGGFKLISTVLNLCVIIPFTVIVLLIGRKVLSRRLELGVAFAALSLPLLTPLLEYHHHVWAIVSYLFLIRMWVRGEIRGMLYLQLPFWIVLLAAGHLADLGARPAGLHSYALATLSVVVLWIMNGIAIIRLGVGSGSEH